MILNTFTINFIESSDKETVYLTLDQSRYFNCEEDKALGLFFRKGTMSLRFGSIELTLRKKIVVSKSFTENTLHLSADLRTRFPVPEDVAFQIRRLEINRLEIGPLVGVFISPKKMAALTQGKKDSVYQELTAAAALLGGICCFFSIGDIDWNKKMIKALLSTPPGFSVCILPLPTVIYDRFFGINSRTYSMELRRLLRNSGHQIINGVNKLGKWETMQALSRYPHLHKYLPKTEVYRFNTDLSDALRRYQDIYLKPDLLYKGKGIFRLKKMAGDSYEVRYRDGERNKVIYLPDRAGLDELMQDYLEVGGGYIIQQTVNLAQYKGYPFDFRVLCQKDWRGMWQSSGIVARIAAPGSIITSPRSGGAVEDLLVVLQEMYVDDPAQREAKYEEIVSVSREISACIDREFGDCVELGLDMALDQEGNVRLLEVNGKPLKVSLKRLNNPQIIRRSYRRPIEYAVYLSGFKAIDLETAGGS